MDPNLTCHADKVVSVDQNHRANTISKFSYEVLLCRKRLRRWLCLPEVRVAVEQLNYLLVSCMSGEKVKSWCSLLGKQPENCALLGRAVWLTKLKDNHKIHKCIRD